jgi:pyrroline-5-carboxylate reductase
MMTQNQSLGFIGGGRVTRILLDGLQRQNALPEKVMVCDCDNEVAGALKSRVPAVELAPDLPTAAAQDLVFLAVHPPMMPTVAEAVRPHLKPDAVVVSLAPKFTLSRLSELLGGFSRLARLIPNAPSLVGAGYNPVAFAPDLSEPDRAVLLNLLQPLGECPEVDEAKLEAYAVLMAMGPTYLWYQLQTLRELAGQFGLSDAEITPALKRMVCGSARTLLDSGLSPAEVMDLIPIKPLADLEPVVTEAYRQKLTALYEKLKP